MDRQYHRNAFVVAVAGIFCVLNTSVVSAQNATNLTCDGCIQWLEYDPRIRTRFFQQEAGIAANRSDVAALEARIEELEALVATLQAGIVPNLGTYLRIGTHNGQRAALFEAVNVMVLNGTGSTDGATNGVGNLIVGYDEFGGFPDDKSGSHNLVVGRDHSYSSLGGFVAGRDNTVSGESATVSAGFFNTASGGRSSVSGGRSNTASGLASSVSGGRFNTASGFGSSVSGGNNRTAPGFDDWVAGALFEDF